MATYDRILAFAVATGQTATVFVVGGKLMDWQMWREARECPTRTRSELRVMVATLNPTLIVSEDPDGLNCRKRGKSLKLLRPLVQAAADEPVTHIKLERPRRYENRYDEAKALCQRFPEIAAWCPDKVKSYESEPRSLTYFEALAYVAEVLEANGQDAS